MSSKKVLKPIMSLFVSSKFVESESKGDCILFLNSLLQSLEDLEVFQKEKANFFHKSPEIDIYTLFHWKIANITQQALGS